MASSVSPISPASNVSPVGTPSPIGASAAAAAAAASSPPSTRRSNAQQYRTSTGSVYGSIVSAIDVTDLDETDGTLRFRLSNVNVSVANGLRRTILSDIPCIGFKTGSFEDGQIEIKKNTCRLNNEILKLRLSCIPIHITDLTIPLENLQVVIAVKNDTKENIYVTTEDFRIWNTSTNAFLDEDEQRRMFPPDPITGDYIIFTRLRPQISDDIPGEEVDIRVKMGIITAGEDGANNVASTCSYTFVVNEKKQADAWALKERELRAQDMTEQEVAYERTNWMTLDGRRHIYGDAFEFEVESVGVFKNRDIVRKACEVLIEKLSSLEGLAVSDKVKIESANLVDTGYDIVLENEDYTVGKIVEYALNALYYAVADDERRISFVGFRKKHPHDTDSIIRVVLNYKVLGLVGEGQSQRDNDLQEVRNLLVHACRLGVEMISNIKRPF